MENTRDIAIPANKRARKSNFSDEEMSCLLEEFGANASILQSRLKDSVTNIRKKQIWEASCAKVNSCGTERRIWDVSCTKVNSRGTECQTIAELKKKWTEMRSVSLCIISARRYPKAGGGKKEIFYMNDQHSFM